MPYPSGADGRTRAARQLAIVHGSLLVAYLAWLAVARDDTAPFGWANNLFYLALATLPLAAQALAARARTLAPGARRAWGMLLAAALLAYVPNLLSTVTTMLGYGPVAPWREATWAAYYVLLAIGLLLLPSAPQSVAGRRTLGLDALIVAVAGASLTTAIAIEPAIRAGEARPGSLFADVIYPVGDLVLLMALCVLLARRARAADRRAMMALAASVAATFAADIVWSYERLQLASGTGAITDPLWAIAEFGWTLGATMQLVDAGREDGATPRRATSMPLALVPHLALAVLLGALVYTIVHGQRSLWIVGGVALCVLLLQARQLLALRDNATLERARLGQEARFRALVQHAADLVVVAAPDGVLRYLSPSASRVLGIEELAPGGPSLLDHVHPDERGALATLLRGAAARTDRAASGATFRCRDRLGQWRRLECVVTNLLDEPSVAGLVLNCRDLSEREALERQLVHAQKTEAIGRLAGGIAHDFNNLLAVVAANTQLLLDTHVAPETRDALGEIDRAARRGADLTRRLLAFSRRQHPGRPTAVVLDAVLAEAEPILRRLVAKDVRLVVRTDAAQAGVQADAVALEQVLINLAVNARDAMPDGGTLTIETQRVSLGADAARRMAGALPGEYVALTVQDTGHGMDEATRARLFEPFFTTKPVGEGTGLGLYIVYGIVSQAGGHVVVDSAPGLGATFRVLLPVHEAQPSTPRPLQAAAPRGTDRLLVVDDEEAIRSALQRYLQRQGYAVSVATDGAAALALLSAEGPFDLVITDVVMPGLDGRALLEFLRTQQPTQPVLCMSGYTEDAAIRELVPPELFIEKPFSLDALAHRIRAAIDASRLLGAAR